VKKLGGWRRTRAVVTLAAPHHGTPLAYLGAPIGFFARSLWQMIPGSPFLRRLNEGPWPAQVRLASIWSKGDQTAPYPCAVIETHGLPHLANVEVDATHRTFLTSKRIYAVLLNQIRAAEEEAPIHRGPLTAMRGGRASPPGGRASSDAA
jgi:triacylglycerol lipase